jgi:hypothetical protein|uniref:Uncharacterized protein n=1 Tax=Siphoviridae sp. ctQtc11 TaxID=2825497 RepID=A0A8S5P4U9_9CAUD|nr:MAG TPA: hypothetical protein [Siphoviridae sp. ctQtc11]
MQIKHNEESINRAEYEKQRVKTMIGKTNVIQTKDKITLGNERKLMDEILDQIDELIVDKYNELKKDCKTYGELKQKIKTFIRDVAWDNDKEYTLLLSKKLHEIYDNDVNKIIIENSEALQHFTNKY